MIKTKLILSALISALFLSTPVVSAELSCPEGGSAMPIQYGDVVNCSLESAGDLDVYAISAEEGDFISANVIYKPTEDDECTSLMLTLRAFDKKNKQLASKRSARCSGTRIEFTAAKTNIHTITISDWADAYNGDYQVEFQCISGPCVKMSLLPKQECTATYDGSELKVPYLEYAGKAYWANFNVINFNPLQLQLDNYGNK